MTRWLFACLAALTLVACGPPPNGPAATGGTVVGQVLSYPCAPVERIGSPCPGRPAAGAAIQLAPAGGGPSTRVVAGQDGRYRADVPAGHYRITVTGRPLGQASREVDVAEGATVVVNFTIDSGIR